MTVSGDWVTAKIDAVEDAAEAAWRALGDVGPVLGSAREARRRGASILEVAQELARSGAQPRRAVAAAFQEYEHAVASLRAAVVRALVDDEGMPLSAVARGMGISRQAATRLYQAGERQPAAAH
jgi:DNA invertase Pin-like site-specific DNA recombinase